jgi:triosephosphate isomerase
VRTLLIVGNWKMHKTASEARPFVHRLGELVPKPEPVEVVLAPPFTALHAAVQGLPASRPFKAGAQDMFWEDQGAFTGEVAAPMLRDLGCEYVILGHSERRHYFAEQDDSVNRKVRAALHGGLHPIFCLGETLDQREAGHTDDVVTQQLIRGLEGLSREEVRTVTIAYEPRWAIGTGRPATVAQAEAVHDLLRQTFLKTWGPESAERVRILYGGSVTPANTKELVSSPLIDGALVGGACLDAEVFARIIEISRECGRA